MTTSSREISAENLKQKEAAGKDEKPHYPTVGNPGVSEQEQALRAIGRTAVGVVHDLNNLIVGILETLREVSGGLEQQSPIHNVLELAINAAEKAGTLSKRLLSLGRRKNISQDPVNLNHVITRMTGLLSRWLGSQVELEIRLEASPGNIRIEQSQIERVIMNLAMNARDAMPTGGKFTIETSNMDGPAAHPGHHEEPPYIKMIISDTGRGMEPRTLQRIFEPFFSTKKSTHATGLGLATLKDIIEENGGEILISSQPQQGSRFTILLPPPAEPSSAQETPETRAD
jgi:two-component system, cell cycle sensor histidine kinase and response regulator CckA